MDEFVFLEYLKPMPLTLLPARSVVLPVRQSRLLISPGSLLTTEQLRSAGDISDIIVPNAAHTGGVARALEVFPNTRVWASQAVMSVKPLLRATHELNEKTWPFSDEIPLIELQGMPRLAEVVFIHKKSSSLIVTDLCFNLTEVTGLGARVIFSLFGTYRKFGVSRLFAKYVSDRDAFEKSLKTVFNHNFDKVIMSHGSIIKEDGKTRLLHALSERGFRPHKV